MVMDHKQSQILGNYKIVTCWKNYIAWGRNDKDMMINSY